MWNYATEDVHVMKKLLTLCPIPNDATSFYRGVGPLSSLQNQGKVELIYHDKPDWTVMKHTDAVFIQRPHLPEYIHSIDLARKFGKPLWLDYDDLLTGIPDSSPARHNYWRQEVQDTIRTALNAADIVSVSTQALADEWKSFAKKIVVIPNAWDDDMYPRKELAPKPEGRPKLLWRGSGGHDEDLYSIMPELVKLAKLDTFDWYFIGQPFWLALRALKDYTETKVAPWNDLPEYFKMLRMVQASVMMVPLTDTPFNRCKSNIAWIEAAWAGTATVAPKLAEWLGPGIINYDKDKPFDQAVLEANDFTASKAAESWEYVESELRLSKVNELRESVLREMGMLPMIAKRYD